MMQKLTKANIAQLTQEIITFLDTNEMQDAVCIYFNNTRMRSKCNWRETPLTFKWEQDDNIDPHDCFEYAAYNHIISMSFEGSLYELLNYGGRKIVEDFNSLFNKYNLYYELGNAWNLTAYPLDDDMEIEYTYYDKPEPITNLYYHSRENYPNDIRAIMETWYNLSYLYGNKGSCVLGAGFEFTLDGKKYFMSACSPWQGNLSWESNVDTVQSLLENIGAIDIIYKWGHMD